MPTVLGIDQSLAHTGVFWVGQNEFGWRQIDSAPRRGADRLLFIRNEILKTVDKVTPDLIALEGYSYGSPGRVFELGELGGTLKVAIHEKNIKLIIAAPTQVKKFLTGNHIADKNEMVAAINSRFQLHWTKKDNNLADAAALALIAEGYLNPELVSVRHAAEVIAELRGDVKVKPKKKSPSKKRFPNI